MPKKINPKLEDAIKEYQSNEKATLQVCADMCGMSIPGFRYNLVIRGIPRHPVGRPKKDYTKGKKVKDSPNYKFDFKRSDLERIYKKTGSLRETGKRFGVSHETVRQRLMAHPYHKEQ